MKTDTRARAHTEARAEVKVMTEDGANEHAKAEAKTPTKQHQVNRL